MRQHRLKNDTGIVHEKIVQTGLLIEQLIS